VHGLIVLTGHDGQRYKVIFDLIIAAAAAARVLFGLVVDFGERNVFESEHRHGRVVYTQAGVSRTRADKYATVLAQSLDEIGQKWYGAGVDLLLFVEIHAYVRVRRISGRFARLGVALEAALHTLTQLARVGCVFLLPLSRIRLPVVVFFYFHELASARVCLAIHGLTARYAAVVFFLHHYFIFEAKGRLALHVHANDTARIAGTMLTAAGVPHLSIVVYAPVVFAVFAHL
jgi:hypothetical protein